LHKRGLVDVLSVGELEGHTTRAAAYWRLTDAGREELARIRSSET
jgi:DNA-binding PadR family transcriptional regulator